MKINKVIILVLFILPSFALDGYERICSENERNKQVGYFLETLPSDVQGPLDKIIAEIRPTYYPGRDQKLVNWLVQCGPFVDFQSWASIICAFNTFPKSSKEGYFYNRSYLFQALCARSNQSDREELCQLLVQLPRLDVGVYAIDFLSVAPNEIVKKWLPALKAAKPFKALEVVAYEPVYNYATALLKYEPIKDERTTAPLDQRNLSEVNFLAVTSNGIIRTWLPPQREAARPSKALETTAREPIYTLATVPLNRMNLSEHDAWELWMKEQWEKKAPKVSKLKSSIARRLT